MKTHFKNMASGKQCEIWKTVRMNFGLIAIIAIGLSTSSGQAQTKCELDAFDVINLDFRHSYKEARSELLKDIYPVIMLMGDDLILVKSDSRDTQRVVPRVYHELKSLAHVPFAIYLKLIYAVDQPLTTAQMLDLKNYCQLIEASLEQLSTSKLNQAQIETQTKILNEATTFIEEVVLDSTVSHSQLIEYTHRSRVHFERNIEDATRAQLQEMYKVVDAWHTTFSKEEKSNLRIIISGHKEPRIKSLATQFFSWYLRVPGEGDVICYTEGVTDEEGMFNTIANHLLSKQAASDIFLNPHRLHEDLLGIAAEKCLKEMTMDLSN